MFGLTRAIIALTILNLRLPVLDLRPARSTELIQKFSIKSHIAFNKKIFQQLHEAVKWHEFDTLA